jgi:hypothetical protein
VGAWVLRSLSVAFWGDGRVSESYLSEVFFLINGSNQRGQTTLNLTSVVFDRPLHFIGYAATNITT